MEFTDRVLKCSDCGAEFVFTAGEQLILPRQAVQERAQALQAVQGEARPRRLQSAPGDPDQLFASAARNNGSLQAHAGQAGVVPLLF